MKNTALSCSLAAFMVLGVAFVSDAYSSERAATKTMKQRVADAEFYGLGQARWGAVAETGYGHAILFNYSVLFEGKEKLICTGASLAPGQSALFVIKATDVKRPKGCADNSIFVPSERFDTFVYLAFDNLLDDKRWISLPPASRQDLGCKNVSLLHYEGKAKDEKGRILSDAGIAPPYKYFLWSDFVACLDKD